MIDELTISWDKLYSLGGDRVQVVTYPDKYVCTYPDGFILYTTTIYRSTTPKGWTQAQIDQNNLDLADLESRLSTLNQPVTPRTSTGTPINVSNIVPPGHYLYVTGSFDGTARGNGPQFSASITGPGQVIVEGRFHEFVYVLGGAVGSIGAVEDDWVSMKVYAPASSVPTQANGNCIISNSYIIPSSNGDHYLDGSTMEIGQINQNLAPIPAPGVGHWEWDPTKSPSIFPGKNYVLMTVDVDLARQANRVPLLIPGDITPDTVKGKKILPHWKMRFTFNRPTNSGTLLAVARMTTARANTI